MTGTTNPITMRAFRESEGTEDWRVVAEGACAFFRTESFAASAELVRAIAETTDDAGHPPDVDIRPGGVTVRLITLTDDYYGLSQRDINLARQSPPWCADRACPPTRPRCSLCSSSRA